MPSEQSTATNRRRYPRHALKPGVQFILHKTSPESQTSSSRASILDLSETGARVTFDEDLEVGSDVRVDVILPDSDLSFSRLALVRWVTPLPKGNLEVGLQWEQVLTKDDVANCIADLDALIAENSSEGIVTTFFMKNQRRVVASNQRKAFLVHIYPKGPNLGKKYQLPTTPVIVGRESTCDITLTDTTISRRHICLQNAGMEYEVLDLESKNGSFVNDHPITRQLLKDGDYLQIGSHIFRYLCGGNIEAEYHEEIYRLTIIDALTNIANKRYLFEFLERELVRAKRYRRPLSVIMFDIDHFKSINDRIGHLGGDFALRELATRVKATVREDELLARFGGEEFAVVLPETSSKHAKEAAERIRELVQGAEFRFGDAKFSVTISAGVATATEKTELSALELLHFADAQLYQAKRQGRNCVRG